MRVIQRLTLLVTLALFAACGGGGDDPQPDAPSGIVGDDGEPGATFDPRSETALYRIVMQNFWSEEEFPVGYPDNAHLSLIGGAVHNIAVSFWSPGDVPTPGLIDLAENGRIDILLTEEVRPAIENGTADSVIEVRSYTGPPTVDGPGEQTFSVTVTQQHPLISLVTMLGPSPDWFVGVDDMPLLDDQQNWIDAVEVDLPLYDGGSRSNMTPVMHGPSIRPPEPVGLIAYDAELGIYVSTTEPQNVAKLIITRME